MDLSMHFAITKQFNIIVMLLLLNDQPLDPQMEMEMKPCADKMFDVRILFVNGAEQPYNQVTEVHWRYPSPIPEPQVAIESDIQRTGFTYYIGTIEQLIIKEIPLAI